MGRAGRKRLASVPRRKGKVSWRETREDPAVLTKWHRARDAYLEGIGNDRRMASQAGKLFASRHLSARQIEVLDRWCEHLADYDRIILGLVRSIHPPALERLGVTLHDERDPQRIAEFKDRFGRAQLHVLQASGKRSLTALNRLCRDEASSAVVEDAKQALGALAEYWKMPID